MNFFKIKKKYIKNMNFQEIIRILEASARYHLQEEQTINYLI